ncbi:L,D-transpeptidase [bacterium]|nr:L,D-transpeptidase [bacterium]
MPERLATADTSYSARELKKERRALEKNIREARFRLSRMTPVNPFMIINTSENAFSIRKGRRLLYQGICSTGSYILLKTHDGEEMWIFKTPRGAFRIRNILTNPVWRMPDWAFVEEGLPVPPPDSPDRFEYGVLGDYAFDIGDGYLIHGTLYQRYLGLPVTHGCIRLGDKDLKNVYENLCVGSRVFIY